MVALPVGLALDLLSPEPVLAKSQTAWQARRLTRHRRLRAAGAGARLFVGEQARACWGAADCRRYGGRTSGLCSTSGAQPGGDQAADCSRCATRGTLPTRAQCAHSVCPTPSRLNSDGTGRTKVTVAADGTCALICAASGGLNRRMLRRRSDAPCRNTNTLMLDYQLGNLGGLGGGAGVDGRPGLQRPRAGRGALGVVGVERLQA